MEPIITPEGFKILQNPDESRNLLSSYYTTIGFNVVHLHEKNGTEIKKPVTVQADETNPH